MLFAIGVAATAAYQVVSTEFTLSTSTRDSETALSVARAGLQRFLAESLGTVGDSVSYAIGSGVATVTTRQLVKQDSLDYLYYIRSEGTVTDVGTPASPARRAVGTYAWLRMSPVKHKAAVMMAATSVWYLYSGTVANGYDQASAYTCSGGGTAGVAGTASAGTVTLYGGGYTTGNPAARNFSTKTAVIDSAGIRWDVLKDPNFPVEFDNAPPQDWSKIPSDSFPVVRKIGDLATTNGDGWSGHGVLIVTGQLSIGSGFSWQGIILAGSMSVVGFTSPYIQGTLISGLNGADGTVYIYSGHYYYNSCKVYGADKSLSYLDLVDGTTFEVNR